MLLYFPWWSIFPFSFCFSCLLRLPLIFHFGPSSSFMFIDKGGKEWIHKACKVMKASGSLMTFAFISCCCPGLYDGEKLKKSSLSWYRSVSLDSSIKSHIIMLCSLKESGKHIFAAGKSRVESSQNVVKLRGGNFSADSAFYSTEKCLLVLTWHEEENFLHNLH